MEHVNNLKKWDGKNPFNPRDSYQHPQDQLDWWDMQIDSEGNIWYRTREKDRPLNMWCPNYKLTDHLSHLEKMEKGR